MSKRLGALFAAAGCALCLAPVASGTAGPATTACALVAAPNGSNSNPGTTAAPFQTAQKLVSSLRAGQTGCLRGGIYIESVTFRAGGSAAAPITLTSYPGETATIAGRMYVAEGADDTTVTGLQLDGSNAGQLPSPTIDANHVTFSYDDVTNDHTGICFSVGSTTWGWATGTLITHDRIHDCGQLPATNYQHGIYVAAATDTTIEWNLIYANADRGIQLYPDAQSTTIDHNIIDDNGEGILFAGEDGTASSDTDVYDNIISNASVRYDVESYWPAGNPVGLGNSVHDNCVWAGREGTVNTSGGGFSAQGNLDVDPDIVGAATHDYEMSASSPCLALAGDVQAAVDGTMPVVPSGPNGGTTGSTPGAGEPGTTASTGPSGGGTTISRSPATPPATIIRHVTAPASRPKPKHTTRKVAVHRRRKTPKRRAKRPARLSLRRAR